MQTPFQARLFTVAFMLAVTLVFISVVSAVHLATAERVDQNSQLFHKQAVAAAMGIAVPEGTDRLLQWYAAAVTELAVRGPTGPPATVYRVAAADTGQTLGFAFLANGAGLWGRITGMVGLSAELDTVTGVRFLDQNETPGLGARISEPWFEAQFRGKQAPLHLVPERTQSTDVHEVDAITGATITSLAVRDMLNRTVEKAPALVAEAPARRPSSGPNP